MNQTWTRLLPPFLRERVEGRDYLQNVIANTGWQFADNIVRMGVGLAVNVWVTRYLGPERFGLLSYATAFVMLIASIGLLGLDGIAVRTIVRDPSSRDRVLGSAFALKLAGGTAAFVLTLAAILVLRPGDSETVLLVAIISLGTLFQAFGAISFWFQANVQLKQVVFAKSGAFLTVAAAKVAMILLDAPLVAFAWAGAADIALGSLGLVAAYRICGHRMTDWQANAAMAKELFRDSWPLLLSDVVMLVYMRVDRIMVGELAGNTELGVYAVAALVAEAFYFIPVAVYTSVFPSIVEAKADEQLFYGRLQQFYNLMALLGYAVAVPVTLLSGWLIPRLFGPAYATAAPLLIGLVWAGVFINLMMARSQFLTAMNWTRLHFLTDLLAAALNIGLNFLFIPRYGAMGAVAASLIAYWFVAHGSCYLFKPLHRTGAMLTRALLFPKVW